MKIKGIEVHARVTVDAVAEAVARHLTTLDNPGFCIMCGCEAEGVEPDARGYECESCGAPCVYGADDLLIRMAA